MNRRTLLLTTTLLALPKIGFSNETIIGAGASFPNPVYQKWGQMYKQATGIALNYQSVGSGSGKNQIIRGTVQFGASDAPMSKEELDKHKLKQFPTVLGAVVPVYNLSNIKIKLTGILLSDIYLGKITHWNDKEIALINQDIKLPNIPINVVYRADGSGTTFVWTSYLNNVDSAWRSLVGASTSVKFPVGTGAKGNEGVAALVKRLPGSIGYVENAYATATKLPVAELMNKEGVFISASLNSFASAVELADWDVPGMAPSLINMPGKNSWPIVSATYVIIPANSDSVKKFFDWCYRNGNDAALKLQYVPLPNKVVEKILKEWASW